MEFFAQISSIILRRGEISQPILNFINGDFLSPKDGKFADTLNPSTGGVVCQYPLSTALDLENAVEAACNALRMWSEKSKSERTDILHNVAELLEKRAEVFIRAENLDQGRAIDGLNKADNDVVRCVGNIKHLTAQAVATMEPATRNQNCVSYAIRHPIGVVGIITPWASPLHSILWHLAPALACGNCAVIKPSCLAPLEVHLLAKTLSDAGVPKGVVNVVYGKGDVVGKALVAHPNVKALALVGSERTASAILRESQLLCTKRFTFTLGNCHPMVVFGDANLDEVLPVAINGSFLHNDGQNVHSIDRIFVHISILDVFKERFTQMVKKLKVGSAQDSTIQVGPLISKEQQQKMRGVIQGAVNDGAEILCGGKVPKLDNKLDKGFFLEPTVLGGFKNAVDNTINTLQVQGPVVRIIPFRTMEEAIEGANGTMYGLSASIWSKDIHCAHRAASQLNAGSVWINDWLPNEPNMPHEDWGRCGLSRTGGSHSIDFYTKLKTVSTRL